MYTLKVIYYLMRRKFAEYKQVMYTYGIQTQRQAMPSSFPLNAWYAAAWDVDLKRALFPRTICGKHVVMYRQSDGRVCALEDACWHRLVPLSA
jgi:phenylpropionate dioxygenase-like ring-hydroxylating dioxygenase large terminal subunit